MNKLIFILFVIICCTSCTKDHEGSGNEGNYYTFRGEIGTNDNSTIITSDSNIVICGNCGGFICIIKVSKEGNLIWRKDLNEGSGTTAEAIVESYDGSFYICGSTNRGSQYGTYSVLLVKTNSSGQSLWSNTYGGHGDDYGSQILVSMDNNIVICGFTYSFNAGGMSDIYLVKVDSKGDTLWTKSYHDDDQEIPFHFMQTRNGEYLVTGTNEDNSQDSELYLLKTDVSGNKIWDKKIGPPTWKWGYCTLELNNGDLLTCGHHTVGEGYSQVLMVKTDAQGNVFWESEIGESNLSFKANAMKQNSDGTFTITGSSYDVSTMTDDILLLKTDQSGNQIWLKKFGGKATDWGINIIKDDNDVNIITGTTFSNGDDPQEGNIFMIRVDSSGNFL
jgi:hypothetical protein